MIFNAGHLKMYISKVISSKIKDNHDTWHIFSIKALVALQYELIVNIFKNRDPRYDNYQDFLKKKIF